MYGRTIGFRIKELTHQGSAELDMSKLLYQHDVKLTSNVTSVEYRLCLVFNKEHHRTDTVIRLSAISTATL